MNNPASLCNPQKSLVPILASCPPPQRGSSLNQGPILRPRRTISMELKSHGGLHLPEIPLLPKSPIPPIANSTLAAAIRNVKHTLGEVVNVLDKAEKFLDPSEILDEAKEGITETAEEFIDEVTSLLPKNGIADVASDEIHKVEKAAGGIVHSITETLHLDPKHNPLSEITKTAKGADLISKAAEEVTKVEKAIQGLNPFKHH